MFFAVRQGGAHFWFFEHPDGTVQIPKGTMGPNEPAAKAVIRELEEESGLTGVRLHPELARLERRLPSGPTSDGPLEDQVWHVFLLEPNSDMPDRWQHVVTDGPTEAGLTFSFRWIPLVQAPELLHSLFAPVVDVLLHANDRQGGGSIA
ncbi:MAG: NUDIX domain-containing protein [bacterium]|nr:NUDIX domain-containing protein [bacterium]